MVALLDMAAVVVAVLGVLAIQEFLKVQVLVVQDYQQHHCLG
jgi:hypothetical protein